MKFPTIPKQFILLTYTAFVLVIAVVALLLLSNDTNRTEAVSDANRIIIPDEEFSFYLEIVRSSELNRDMSDELKEKTMAYAKTVYSKLMLANRYGIVDAYSLEKLQLGHAEENKKRKKMKENGQVFYGPEQLELRDYFEYFIDEMTMKTITDIAEKESASLEKESKTYYAEIKDLFSDETLTFDLIKRSEYGTPDEVETMELNNDTRRILENTEPEMMTLVESLQVGDEATYMKNNEPQIIKMKSRERQDVSFEDNKYQAIKIYVNDVYYESEMERIKDEMEIEVQDPIPQ